MTETLNNSTAAPAQTFPESLGFGFAEVVALLTMQMGDEARKSAAAMRLESELEQSSLISAGSSSLVARGLATVDAGVLSVSGPVAAVTSVLTSPAKRVQIDLLTADRTDNVLSFESSDFSIILQPRAYLSWFAMAQKPGLSTAEANFYVIRKHLQDNPDGGAAISLLDGDTKVRLLIKANGDSWTVATNNSDGSVVDENSGLSESQLLERIRHIRQD